MQAYQSVVITGCNKGVGFGILSNLVQKNYKVIMACRNLELAEQSRMQVIERLGISKDKLETIQLDVSSSQSIDKFLVEFNTRFQKADILLNNAGIASKGDAFDETIVAETFQTNFYGTVELSEKFLPYLNDHGKIIFIGSMVGKLARIPGQEIRSRFSNEALTKDQLLALAKEFYDAVKDGSYSEKGWPKSAYGMSKVCVNVYASILGGYNEIKERDIQVYACCPGWVKTDMAGQNAHLTIDEGALTPVHLVELPNTINPSLQGRFFEKSALSSI